MTQTATTDRDDQEIADLLADVVAGSLQPLAPEAPTRVQLMDLLSCPRLPIDRSAYEWADLSPGLKVHLVSDDSARGVKSYLVWGAAGAATPRHGHIGDEVILVIDGQLQDQKGTYGPGEICRSRAGDVHQEQVVGDDDCVCFVVYYGELFPA